MSSVFVLHWFIIDPALFHLIPKEGKPFSLPVAGFKEVAVSVVLIRHRFEEMPIGADSFFVVAVNPARNNGVRQTNAGESRRTIRISGSV